MLPDLWRMVDRRVRATTRPGETTDPSGELAFILSGIQHHLEADRWFHAAAPFTEGERLTADALRAGGMNAPKIALFAHVAWELSLDGALVRREGLENTLQILREGFDVAGGELAEAAVSLHHFDRTGRPFAERRAFDAGLQGLLAELTRGRLIAAYQSGAGIARRIDGIRVRLGFAGMMETERQRLGEVLYTIPPHADAALKTLLATAVHIPTER